MTTIEAAALHVELPRSSALTDVLLAPPGDAIAPGELRIATERVTDGLTHATRRLPEGSQMRIDMYRLQLALGAPNRLPARDRVFEPSAPACRRAIGTLAMSRCLKDGGLVPADAVSRILEEADASLPGMRGAWWETWFRNLPRPAKAIVQSEATTWAIQLHGALEWERFDEPVRVGGDFRWLLPARKDVSVTAKADVHTAADDRPVMMCMPSGVAGPLWSTALAATALTASMVRGAGHVPARIVGFWPASGQVRILNVEHGTLDRASRLLVEAARILVRVPPSAV